MDLSKIPNRLRGEPYFCLMKLEKKPGKDKKDKVPYRTNGTRADPTNPEHFTSLENVMKVFDKDGYDGIGIGVFDDVIAIDIDHCVEDGKLSIPAPIEPPVRSLRATILAAQSHYSGGGNHHSGN